MISFGVMVELLFQFVVFAAMHLKQQIIFSFNVSLLNVYGPGCLIYYAAQLNFLLQVQCLRSVVNPEALR